MKAIINLKLPFALYMVIDDTYEFFYNGKKILIKTKFEQKKDYYEEAKNILFFYDKYGLYGNTWIEIEIDVVSIEEVNENQILDFINIFIDTYRKETKHYWIENVNRHDIAEFNIKFIDDNKTFVAPIIATTFGSIGKKIPDEDVSNQIKKSLFSRDDEKLYKIYLLNAFDHILQRRYELAIIEANIGLENFLYSIAYDYLKDNTSEDEIDDWFKERKCKLCGITKFKTYISIIEFMNRKKVFSFPIEKLKNEIKQIKCFKKYDIRNIIVHGKIDKISNWHKERENAGLQAVFYFYDLINIFEKYNFDSMLLPPKMIEYMRFIRSIYKK